MKTVTKQTRYKTLKNYPGIRKDTSNGTYLVSVMVNGRRLSKTFLLREEAWNWKLSIRGNSFSDLIESEDKKFTFKDLWEKYKLEHLPTLEKSSQENRLMMAKFFDGFWENEVNSITPGVIANHILAQKEIAKKIGSKKRKNFDHEIKLLKAMFNWYKEEVDHTFANPVTKRHKTLGILRVELAREKKLSVDELKLFLEALKEKPFWYDFALTQLLIAGRVQEVAGLQKQNIDFKGSRLVVKEVAVWSKKTKRFDHLKPTPKNGEIREVYLCGPLASVLEKRIGEDLSSSTFVFHENGQPLSYRQIQYHYDLALEKAGLGDRFSGTHILRHSMATLTRAVTGSLDSAQAVTGHKDMKLAQHYAGLQKDENKKALVAVESYLNEQSFFGDVSRL